MFNSIRHICSRRGTAGVISQQTPGNEGTRGNGLRFQCLALEAGRHFGGYYADNVLLQR
jgi:hypothetical protein